MATLSELVKFRNLLLNSIDGFNLDPIINQKIDLLESLKTISDYDSKLDDCQSHFINLKDQSKVSLSNLTDLITIVDKDIDALVEKTFCTEEYFNRFAESPQNDSNESPRESHVINKIIQNCHWRYPSLLINPPSKRWIDYMVASDPLYLTYNLLPDVFFNLENLISEYPKLYQQRLRLYNIKDRDFTVLPQKQFRFVLCWNTFTRLAFTHVEKYLIEIFNLLKPGGTFIFNYNNCDLETPAEQAEKLIISYCNARLIKKVCESIGYEVVDLVDIHSKDFIQLSYAEIRKPGTLTTPKAHQAMAQIIEK